MSVKMSQVPRRLPQAHRTTTLVFWQVVALRL